MKSSYYLGIDAGATKTGVTLINEAGEVLATVRGQGTAIIGAPHKEACDVLASLTASVLHGAQISGKDIYACGFGLNGVDFDDEIPMQLAGVARAISIPEENIRLVNDGIVALWGATSSPAAAILQFGTGFTSAFRSKVGQETLFDHLNTGKTIDIRGELMVALSRMIDGRMERTPLLETGLAYFGIKDERRFREMVYRKQIPLPMIRNTPPLLFKAWEENDPAAVHIIDKALDDYVLAGRTMIRRTGAKNAAMVFGGGVILHAPDRFWKRLERGIKEEFPDSDVHPPLLPPEYGAALMGSFSGGENYSELFRRLREQYESR